jgi:hypothetical protein
MQKKLMELRENSKVRVSVTYAGDVFTVAEAFFSDGSVTVTGEGIARRCSRDKRDDLLGEDIAKGRALRALEEKVNGRGRRRHRRRFVDLMRG